MSAPFVPFTEIADRSEAETPAFQPVSLTESHTPPPVVSPEKALADLADALRHGLGSDVLEQLLGGLGSGRSGGMSAYPLPLRDLSLPVREQSPADPMRAPSIVVTRVGDLVQKVTVECPCGERISLDCVY